MAARVVLPPSGTTLLFVAPRNAVAARLTCRKRFRPIYSCSRIRMDYSPASLRPGEPSVNRVHSPRRARSRATRANVGTPLEPFASLRTLEEPRSRISCWNFNGLIGGRTRTRTLDPLIKSQLVIWFLLNSPADAHLPSAVSHRRATRHHSISNHPQLGVIVRQTHARSCESSCGQLKGTRGRHVPR